MVKQTASGGIMTVHGPTAQLDPWPIPREDIISGDPQASGRFLWQSEDKRLGNGIWTCTPGVFNATFTWDETIYLTDGELTISDEEGNGNTYRAGDLIFIPIRSRTRWEVTKTVRKAFHLRSETPVEL